MSVPQYYRIQLDPIPRILYGKTSTIENFRWTASGTKPRECEINYIIEGGMTEIREDGDTLHLEEGTATTFVNNRRFTQWCDTSIHRETCLGLLVREEPVPLTEEQVLHWDNNSRAAILPAIIEDKSIARRIGGLLKTAIRKHRDHADPARIASMGSTICEILSLLTEYAVTQAQSRQQKSYMSGYRFCRGACAYVAEHLDERIQVEDVAKHLCISYSYLSKLFSRHMGLSLIEYINREKVAQVQELVASYGQTLEEAGKAVGITDSKYLSSLFRKHTGMTVTEFRHQCRLSTE